MISIASAIYSAKNADASKNAHTTTVRQERGLKMHSDAIFNSNTISQPQIKSIHRIKSVNCGLQINPLPFTHHRLYHYNIPTVKTFQPSLRYHSYWTIDDIWSYYCCFPIHWSYSYISPISLYSYYVIIIIYSHSLNLIFIILISADLVTVRWSARIGSTDCV